MIQLKDIEYSVFEDDKKTEKKILEKINLTFPKGKLTVITGHNGSGKSTLIKLIMGINHPTYGEVFFNEKCVTNSSISERANMGITLAFQQPVRFKGLTVRDLLNTASKNQNNLADACQYLAQVGLCAKDYIDRPVDNTLSGGELKRIELALALAKGGEVFLFDEPEAGIDLWSFKDLVNIFKNLTGKTVIVVSHQKKLIDNADYVLLLNSVSDFKFGTKEEIVPELKSERCGRLGGER